MSNQELIGSNGLRRERVRWWAMGIGSLMGLLLLAALSPVLADSPRFVEVHQHGDRLSYLFDLEEDRFIAVPRSENRPRIEEPPSPFPVQAALRSSPESILPGQWEVFPGVSWGCNGPILAMAEGKDGLIYFGGSFSVCADVEANNIVAYDPATNEFSALGEGPMNGVNSQVSAIEVVGDQVYVGGFFFSAGGMSANSVAIWDANGWQPLGNNEFISGIQTLHWHNGALYVGGFFTQIGSGDDVLAANRVARWQDGIWSALGEGVNDGVYAITSWNNQIFIGGSFTEAGGDPASRIVAWNGAGFSPLQGAFGEGVSAPFFTIVFSVAVGDEGVYVGGQFSEAGGQAINNIAFWDGGEWFALGEIGTPEQNGTNAAVRSIAVNGDELVVSGGFSGASGIFARQVARWDGAGWQSLGLGDDNGIRDGFTEAVLWTSSGIYVGGFDLFRAGTVPVNGLARFDLSAGWQALGSGDGLGIAGTVQALLVDGDNVWVGGRFGLAGNVPARSLARWDGQAWHAVLPTDNSSIFSVRALALDANGDLIIGGNFFVFGAESVFNIGRWDGAALRRVADASGGFNSGVLDVGVAEDEICAAGFFSAILTDTGNVEANGVACFDGDDWQPLGSGLNNQVSALAHFDGELYAGGFFNEAGGEPANRIARWDGTDWRPLGTPPNDGVNSAVQALASAGSELILGGSFSQIAGQNQFFIGSWDGGAWLSRPDWLNSSVLALSASAQGVYAAGNFTQSFGGANPIPLDRVGLWNGERWRSLGLATGTNLGSGRPEALASTPDGVWVGGNMTQVGGQSTAGLALFRVQDEIFRDRFEPAQIGDTFKDCPDCPTMVMIPAGSFVQGSPASEPQSFDTERPQRVVNVPAFAMGQTAVTFDEWDACVADGGCTHNPGDAGWGRGNRPVINVSWNDAQQYVTWLSNRTGQDYRLPSESEWEYAARAGTTGRFNTGDCISTDQANFDGTVPALGCPLGIWRGPTLPVASFAPNALGLFDTHGNVFEWVHDCWNESYSGAPNDGSAWNDGDCTKTVWRGGSRDVGSRFLRAAYRAGLDRDFRGFSNAGFRVARSIEL